MLGLIFIYWIGKYFYRLAEKFNQNKWLFAFLGVIMYYVGTVFLGFCLGIAIAAFGLNFDYENTLLLSLIAFPFGLLFSWVFYYLLEKKWSKIKVEPVQSIDDIGKE
ncbi:hypothetical protein [uncultured Flavobacterium sp.]|uniref:hypothetical protein n=1 Tax=uncultured Flavobacterium sp. TaxID=165435 RepID=UPI0030EBEBE2